MRSEKRDVGNRAPAYAEGPDRGQQRKLAGDDAVGVAGASALLVVCDLDVICAGFREAVCETNRGRAAVRAELANYFETGIENRDHGLQRAANQHRAILKR